MGFNMGFLEEFAKVVPVIPPQVQNGSAVTGFYTDMSVYNRLSYLLAIGNRAGATTPEVTINQATTSAGGSAKALNFDTIYTGVYSQSADSLAAASTDGDSFALSATDYTHYVISITAKMLDKNNSFRFVAPSVATPGANDVPICCYAVLYEGTWSGKPATLPSVVAPTN